MQRRSAFLIPNGIILRASPRKSRMIPRQSAAYSWSRHPLAFLVEAADDICYAIVDIEDGYDLGYLCFEEAEQILKPIAGERSVTPTMKARDKVAKWRAIAIGNLINAAVEAFKTNQNDILDGTFRDDLIAHTEYKSQMAEATSLARKRIYWSERKTRIEIAASEIIFGLLDFFVPIAIELEQSG